MTMSEASSVPRETAARPFGARLDVLRGEPKLAAGLPVTPIARRLALWWPGGGWVYAWPVAIEYPVGNTMQRARIIPIQTIAQAALATLGLAALVAFVAQRRVRRLGR